MIRVWETIIVVAIVGCVGGREDPPSESPEPGARSDPTGRPVLIVHGTLDPEGRRLVDLKPPRTRCRPGPVVVAGSGEYELVVRYRSGEEASFPFDALIADDSPGSTTQHGFFEVAVPLRPGASSVVIRDRDGSVLGRLQGPISDPCR